MQINNNEQVIRDNANSSIVQVQGDYNINGITEDRARLICREECQKALQEWSFEAGRLVENRVQKLEDKLLPKMLKQDESLRIFGDPSFQLLLRKAQISAGCSDREDDYEMLSELLLHRSEQNGNRERRLGISKAVEIVDQIDEKALTALAVVYTVSNFYPTSDDPIEALNLLENLYAKLIGTEHLPNGSSWIEHLDLLSSIRVESTGHFRKMSELIPSFLPRFFYLGLPTHDEALINLKKQFVSLGLPLNFFCKHKFKKGYENFVFNNDLDHLYIVKNGGSQRLSDGQRIIMTEAMTLMHVDGQHDAELTENFWKCWDNYPTLKKLKEWWNALSEVFSFTPVGVALSNAYIHGKDSSVPCKY